MTPTESIEKRIDLIRNCANEDSPTLFAARWESVIHRVRDWFGKLPLSPQSYKDEGGAFRATIETAYYSMRTAGGFKFGATLTSAQRRELEPQYNYAVFLASITSWLDEPNRHFVIHRSSTDKVWSPSAHMARTPWLAGATFSLSIREKPLEVQRMITGGLAQYVIGSDVLEGLNPNVLADLFGAINPDLRPQGAESLVHTAVRKGVQAAIEFDRRHQAEIYTPAAAAPPTALTLTTDFDKYYDDRARTGEQMSDALAEPPPVATTSGLAAVGGASTSQPAAPRQLALDGIANVVPLAGKQKAGRGSGSLPASPGGKELFEEILKGASRSTLDFFVALHEDVSAGKVEVKFEQNHLVLTKKIFQSYGLTGEMLSEGLKKKNLLIRGGQNEVVVHGSVGAIFRAPGAAV